MNFDKADKKITDFLHTSKGKKLKIIVGVGIIAIIFFSQLFFNYLTQLMSDDYSYSKDWASGEKLTQIVQIFTSAKSHYFSLNGRIVNHLIAQFFLLLDNIGFGISWDICNSLIYLALIFLIYYHSKGTFKNFKILWFAAIHLCLWIFIPDYAGCFFWLVGSSNYCWSITLALLFLVPYTYFSSNETIKKANIISKIILSMLYLPLGVVAGNTNENTAVALLIMIVLFFIKFLLEKKKLSLWMFTGNLGVLLGFAILIFSPGQNHRVEQSGGFGGIGSWLYNAFFITFDVFEYLSIPLFLLFTTLILVFSTNKNIKLPSFYGFLIFLIGSGSSIYCMMVSPQFPERSWTPPVIFAIIAFGQLLNLINSQNGIYRRAVCSALAIATLFWGTSYASNYFDIKQTVLAYNEREEYIVEQIEKGETTLVLDPVRGWTKYNLFDADGDLGPRSDEWPNTAIAKYYGVERVINSESKEGIQYDLFE